MTLIVTHINRFGIIHASDSNLTTGNDTNAGEGQKTFNISFLNAGLTVAGCYSVENQRMDIWMTNFIQIEEQKGTPTLKDFSHNLKATLDAKMTNDEKSGGSIIHIAGYVEENGISHPEFWFVRNVHRIDPSTGNYTDIDLSFEISEDFWTRDYPQNNLNETFQNPKMYSRQIYVNGFSPGRIGFNVIQRQIEKFFINIWQVEDWEFRPPLSIEDTELLVKSYMQIIDTLFTLSDYPAKYIGGTTQTLLIKQPDNIIHKII